MEFFFLVGSVQAIFLAFLLTTRPNKQAPDRFLIGWMFFLGIHLLAAWLSASGFYREHPRWFGIDAPFPLVEGPAVFLYARLATRQISQLRWAHTLHLVPYFFFAGVFIYRIQSFEGDDVYRQLTAMIADEGDLLLMLFGGLLHVHLIIYSVAAFITLRKYSAGLPDQFSYTEEISMVWLRAVVVSFAVVSLTIMLGLFISDLMAWVSLNTKGYMFFVALSALPFYLTYIAFTNKINYTPEQPKARKYADSALTPERSKELAIQLTALMATDKPYLVAKISLVDLADMMAVSPKELSQVINENFQQNFFNYINRYRVEEAKQRLHSRQYDGSKILHVGLDCGFSTKSSFNAIFKRFTGQTPSEYKASLLGGMNDSEKSGPTS